VPERIFAVLYVSVMVLTRCYKTTVLHLLCSLTNEELSGSLDEHCRVRLSELAELTFAAPRDLSRQHFTFGLHHSPGSR